jgi:hypothetical protein
VPLMPVAMIQALSLSKRKGSPDISEALSIRKVYKKQKVECMHEEKMSLFMPQITGDCLLKRMH